MAEVHPTSATITVTLPPQGSTLTQLQNDVDALKQENKDLRTMLESLMKEFKDLKKVKVEAVSRVSSSFPPLSARTFHLRSASVHRRRR
jgi:predicted  nucleic acid-binding Zn-ribbon protein